MIRRLQIKFVIINMTMVTAMLCIIFGLVYHFTRANLENESIGMMKAVAAEPFHLGRPDAPSADLRLPYFTVQIGMQGELISTGGGYYDLSDREFLEGLVEESLGSHKECGILREHDLRYYRQSAPRGTVLVFSDMSSERTTLQNLFRSSLMIGVFAFFAFLVLSILLSRWAVKPVAEAWRQQKQFVADASHELKTPLTVILTNAELLQNEGYSPEEHRNFSRSILLMSQQMKLLVEKMLELARTDTEQRGAQMERVDLSRLVMDEALSFEGVFVENGLTLESSAEPGIVVRANAQALRQVVGILLDNAQKYSACGGDTTLRLSRCGQNRCRIAVSDPGTEIPPGELKQIFRRFYRRDEARSRDGSFGLGLSIAENIVQQHKGRIWAESGDGRNTFFVELKMEK